MTVAVRSGPLRCPIRIMRRAESRDSTGAVLANWALLRQWRASIEPLTLRGQERVVGAGLQQDITHKVRIRFLRGLRAKDRISWLDDGTERTLEILSIADILERNRLQELLCREIVNAEVL